MSSELWQWNFVINDHLHEQVKLKRKIWLKKGELFLEKKADKLQAFLLGKDEGIFSRDEILASYFRFTCLISSKAPNIENAGGVGLKSESEFGKPNTHLLSTSVKAFIPDDALPDIEKHAPKFIRFIGEIHDKYIETVSNNEFIEIALDYFYDAEKKFVYSDEGFISCMISMEALFNEGPSDIKYKLSHRAAFLLGLCGMDSVQTFSKLKEFYNTRSKLVHGGGDLPYDPDRHLASLYTRRCITIFLILLQNASRREIGKKQRKNELLLEIDHAMLNINQRKQLKSEINKGLKHFELPVPRVFEGRGARGHYRVTAW
jgi:hypothetical protein